MYVFIGSHFNASRTITLENVILYICTVCILNIKKMCNKVESIDIYFPYVII